MGPLTVLHLVACGLLVTQIHISSASLCSAEYGCGEEADDLIDVIQHVRTEDICQKLCFEDPDCNYYTWYTDGTCFLLSSCPAPDTACEECHTGPPICPSTVPPSTTNHPETCASPSNPPNGKFDCYTDTNECHLLCDPGYATSSKSSVSCTRDGRWSHWSHDPREMSCVESVLLITGGDGGLEFVELYSSTNSCVTALPYLPDLRDKHSVDYVDGEVLLCGGYSSQGTCLTLQLNNTWSKHSNLTAERYSHSSAVHKSDLYLIGGGSSSTSEVWMHNNSPNDKWQFAWDVTDGTLDGCMVTTGADTAIVTGGHECNKCVYQYNLGTGQRTQLQSMYEGRSSHGCSVFQFDGDEHVLVAGGWDGHNIRSAEVLNLRTGKWRIVGDLAEGKRGVQLAVVEGGKVIATGGRVGTVVASVEIYDVELEQWSPGLDLTHRRAYHAIAAVPSTRFGC